MIEILKRILSNLLIRWLSRKVDKLNSKIDKAQQKLEDKIQKRDKELGDDVWSDL